MLMPSPASLCWWGLWSVGCKTTGHLRDTTQVSLGNSIHLWQNGGGQVLTADTTLGSSARLDFVLVLYRNI